MGKKSMAVQKSMAVHSVNEAVGKVAPLYIVSGNTKWYNPSGGKFSNT